MLIPSSISIASSLNDSLPDWSKIGCPVCCGRQVEDFFDLPAMPVYVGMVYPTKCEALAAPTGHIRLACCLECGFVGNRAFNHSLVNFAPGYEISLHYSPIYREFLAHTASRLIERYAITGKTIVEIGCGSGYFLRLLCEAGSNDGFGFDPSIEEESVVACGSNELRLTRDLYSHRNADIPASLVCLRHVLQHITNPIAFLRTVRTVIESRQNVIVYCEVPNAAYMYQEPIRWNIFYEHCCYYQEVSLVRALSEAGFGVMEAGPCYVDNQYLFVEANSSANVGRSASSTTAPVGDFLRMLSKFMKSYQESVARWKDDLRRLKGSGKRVAAWGAGGRAINFLNLFSIGDWIPYVVDINPNRQNGFLPGTGQKLVSPEFLASYRPEILLVTNVTYENEIRSKVHQMGLDCDLVII